MKTLLAIVIVFQARAAFAERYMCQVEVNGRWDAAYPCSLEIRWDEQLVLRASVAFGGHKIEGAKAQLHVPSNPATPKPGEIVLTDATLRLPVAQRREDDDLSVYGVHAGYTRLVPDRDGWIGRVKLMHCEPDRRCAWTVRLAVRKRPWPVRFRGELW